MKNIVVLVACLMLVACTGSSVPEGASFLRISKGSYGAQLLESLGLAAEGDYCMISSSETNYEWTSEDLEFLNKNCSPDSEGGRMLEAIRLATSTPED